mmetsp:Transcript_9340/g.23715  ORF Transcript_9340/g.23715 Transcript_9340/m.23715 type:complete len:105 (+) Transcript_9340:480-794(+)
MEYAESFLRSKFVRAGLPLVAFIVGGSVGMSFLLGERIRLRDASMHVDEERLPGAKYKASKFTIEAELQRLKDHINLATYENKPVPRPEGWEEYVLPGAEEDTE